jgi:hypothetical protein
MTKEFGVQFPAEAKDFSLLHSVQTSFGAHPAFYNAGSSGSFPMGVKWQGYEADHSSPSIAEVKNGVAILPLPDTSSWDSAQSSIGNTLPFYLT